jgi:protein-disulfide isomerase
MRLNRALVLIVELLVLAGLGWMQRDELDALHHGDATVVAPRAAAMIDVWGDFQCPACKSFARQTLPALQAAFVRDGRAVIVWHNAPMLGPDSVRDAEAADCASDQNRFWAFHDALFSRADAPGPNPSETAQLEQLAADVGLNSPTFTSCLEGGTHRLEVNHELAAARRLAITSLPGVFVDNQPVVGPPGFLQISALIERDTLAAPDQSG